ncbi:MAG TPA: aldo/keto reductase [Usitatibacter sp.]|jgi:aryl-alcohol dehydrogenase-like predicted oxidoreductase|nr:aldo/keto reductase [Usitatibacter sp.]
MDRRDALRFLAAGGAAAWVRTAPGQARTGQATLQRAIPSSGEKLPAIGMGTWITFDVGRDAAARAVRGEILRRFFASGGRLVDSSPMYESSEEVLGATMPAHAPLFSATKVWTLGAIAGRRQVEQSRTLWRLPRFDLLEVHNFLDWETHLPMLQAMKSEGHLRYVGVTTSHGRRHDVAEQIMRTQKIDFVQFTYNVAQRGAERDLLPLAAERGIAVIINRPFDGGELFGAKTARPLPGWARDIGCGTWAEAFLKFVVSHPAVTCAIPATSKPEHMLQNMRALAGPLPDAKLRARMAGDYEAA